MDIAGETPAQEKSPAGHPPPSTNPKHAADVMSVIVDTYTDTVSNGCCNLVTAVDSFIGDNFSKITASPNFLEYSLENVKTLKIDNLRELWRCPGGRNIQSGHQSDQT